MAAVPRCAVVIPTFNGAHLLSTCLKSLLAEPPERCEIKVVVVDDASDDSTVERFSDYDERLTMVARERNGGFGVACNEGARAAGDVDYLVFLNNDTIPLPGWLDALVEEAAARPGAARGVELISPGTIQHAAWSSVRALPHPLRRPAVRPHAVKGPRCTGQPTPAVVPGSLSELDASTKHFSRATRTSTLSSHGELVPTSSTALARL